MKRILMLTSGNIDHPSSRIRGVQYIPYLEKEGFEVKWIPRIPIKTKGFKKILFPIQKRVLSIYSNLFIQFGTYDIVYNQRLLIGLAQVKIIKRRNKKLIFDFDDAIYIDDKNKKSEERVIKLIKLSDQVIVANEVLSTFSLKYNFNVSIITTPVDTDRIKPQIKTESGVVKIGWIGTSWTTKYLSLIKKSLKHISRNYNIKLILIGANKQFEIEEVSLSHINWHLETEADELVKFDIGIMPLTDDKFSAGKGGYKLLQYMAAGIPSVASPVGINSNIVIEGITGFLAKTEEEWIEKMELLVKDFSLRKKMGTNSRQICEQKYSREICFKELIKIIKA